jgi:L-alanine-DL-glutamate epimerase-like enolase superfamily enzyme
MASDSRPKESHIVRAEVYAVSLAYAQAKTWTIGGSESESHYITLRLIDDAGREGAAEVVCKPAWNGATQRVLATSLEDIAWPMIQGADARDDSTGARIGRGVAGAIGVQSLLDNAWRDLNHDGSGGLVRVPNATVLNRDDPAAMAEAATRAVFEHGCPALKIKIGQGIAIDTEVLARIKQAVGNKAMLTADANSAYAPEDIEALDLLMMEYGVAFLEDPCTLVPDLAAERVITDRQIPVLVDRGATSRALAQAFADRGATHFSTKPSRIGLSEAEAVIAKASDLGGGVCIGTYAESAVGALQQIRLAAGILDQPVFLTAELDFHRDFADQYSAQPLRFEDGCAVADTSRTIASQIDWDKLSKLSKSTLALQ